MCFFVAHLLAYFVNQHRVVSHRCRLAVVPTFSFPAVLLLFAHNKSCGIFDALHGNVLLSCYLCRHISCIYRCDTIDMFSRRLYFLTVIIVSSSNSVSRILLSAIDCIYFGIATDSSDSLCDIDLTFF